VDCRLIARRIPVYLLVRFIAPHVTQAGANPAVLAAIALLGAFTLYSATFQPWIDHRFARRIYDPIQVVDRFNHDVLNLGGPESFPCASRRRFERRCTPATSGSAWPKRTTRVA